MTILVRLDDYTPNRRREGWAAVGTILDELGIRPLVAVVPDDRYFGDTPTTAAFWDEVRGLQAKGWGIGVHGETHDVVPIARGAAREIFFATKSEFIGLSLPAQLAKLDASWRAFAANGVTPVAFVAPNHGFDAATVRALREQGRIQWISDGISWRPYRDRGLAWIPQIDWKLPRLRFGLRTVCLHPSTMTPREIDAFGEAARRAAGDFIAVDQLAPSGVCDRGVSDAIFEAGFVAYYRMKVALYHAYRRTRGRDA